MTRVRVLPAADRDVAAILDYYAQAADLDVALRFVSAFESTCSQLAEHPMSGVAVTTFTPRLVGLRFSPIQGFENHLTFHLAADVVDIVRVLHTARDLDTLMGHNDDDM